MLYWHLKNHLSCHIVDNINWSAVVLDMTENSIKSQKTKATITIEKKGTRIKIASYCARIDISNIRC